AMAMVPAYVAYSLAPRTGLAGALAGALFIGVLLGALIERGVVRRLLSASATAQTVGTVGVLGLLIAFAARAWGTTPVRGVDVFPDRSFPVGNTSLHLGEIGLLAVALLAVFAIGALFRLTDVGLAMRGTADNRR